MPRGYRCVIVAAFGWLSLSAPSHAEQLKPDQTKAESHTSRQLDRIAAAIEKQPVASAPDRGCEPPNDNRQSDLCAQWKAADAAAESASWAFWTLILTLGGLALGGGTLFAAWRAAFWAKKAAEYTETGSKASLESLEETRKANALQLRPYVFIVGDDDEDPIPFEQGSKLPFAFKNYGITPALNVRMQINSDVIPRPIGDFIVELEPPRGRYGTIAPGALIKDYIKCDLAASEIAEIAAGKVMLVRIRISYDLHTGGSDEHDVTMFIDGLRLPTSQFHTISDAERQRT